MSFIISSSAALNAFLEDLASAAEPEAIGIPDIAIIAVPGFIDTVVLGVGAGCCAIAGPAMTASATTAGRLLKQHPGYVRCRCAE